MAHLLTGFPNQYNLNILRSLQERLVGHDFGYGAGVLPHTLYFRTERATGYTEQFDKVGGMPAAGAWGDGNAVPLDEIETEWSVTLTQAGYGLGAKISRQMLRYGRRINAITNALADSLLHLLRTRHANVLNNALTTVTSPDGQSLVDTDHPSAGGGNRSNELATPAALSWASIENVRLLGANHVDYSGKSRPIMYNALIVPNALRRVARQLVGSPLQYNTTDNAINPDVNAELVIVDAMLTSATAFFLLNRAASPLLSLVGRPLEFNSYPDPPSESQVFYGATDFVEAPEDFVGIAGTAGA